MSEFCLADIAPGTICHMQTVFFLTKRSSSYVKLSLFIKCLSKKFLDDFSQQLRTP